MAPGGEFAYMRAMIDDMYSPDLLALAADIPHVGALPDAHGKGRARTNVCGSFVEATVKLDDAGCICDLGLEVQACAIGQASASIFGRHAIGASLADVESARAALLKMLKEGGDPPPGRFAELDKLKGVKEYPSRHVSCLLAFKAAAEALEEALEERGA